MNDLKIHSQKRILITGAAGNLGNLLAQHLKDMEFYLNLLIHQKDVAGNLKVKENIHIFQGDLATKETLYPALEDVDVIVHFAGVLFKRILRNFSRKRILYN